MKIVVLNENELKEEEMESIVVKARAIIINSNNEIYLSKYGEMFLLPGGKIEEDETLLFGLKRELSEELGIIEKNDDFEPLILIKQYNKGYPSKDNCRFYNRLNITYYYLLKTNEDININESHLTISESANNFKTIIVDIEKAKEMVRSSSSNNLRANFYSKEFEVIFNEIDSLKETV